MVDGEPHSPEHPGESRHGGGSGSKEDGGRPQSGTVAQLDAHQGPAGCGANGEGAVVVIHEGEHYPRGRRPVG